MQPTRILLMSMPDTFLGFNIAARLPNLGLVSIAGNRNQNESEFGVLDLILRQRDPLKIVREAISKFNPEIVGLSSMTFQFPTALRIAKWIKNEYSKGIKIILGGYHPSLCYDEIANTIEKEIVDSKIKHTDYSPWVDFILRGEGEIGMREFIHAYRTGDSFSNVEGLSWLGSDNKFRHNQIRQVADLTELKLPDRSSRLLKNGYHVIGKPADVVETSRGCTNACKFCSITKMYGRNVRYYKLERVLQDIKACHDNGARSVIFIDDNITLDPARFEKLCDMIIAEGLNDIEFHTQASAAGLLQRDTLLPKMSKAGFSVVFFGIENLNPRNLQFFKKSIPVRRLKTLVNRIHNNNMISFGGFIFGNPYDTIRDFEFNVQFARTLDLDFPAFQIITPFPKTEIREELLNQGLITNPENYSKYNGIYANVKTHYMSSEQLEREVLRSYYNYYTPDWLFRRLFQKRLFRKYFRYFLQIISKYYKIALSSWSKSIINGIRVETKKIVENEILEQFKNIRNIKTESVLKS